MFALMTRLFAQHSLPSKFGGGKKAVRAGSTQRSANFGPAEGGMAGTLHAVMDSHTVGDTRPSRVQILALRPRDDMSSEPGGVLSADSSTRGSDIVSMWVLLRPLRKRVELTGSFGVIGLYDKAEDIVSFG